MLLRRIVLLYIVLLLCRIVFYCYNYALIGPLGWQEVLTLAGGGLKFDTVSVLYANLLFIVLSLLPFHFRERSWYRRILFWYYAVINSLLIVAVNLADCVYFRYTQKRFTSDEIFFTDNSNSAQLVLKFAAENWYLLLVGAVLIWLFVWGYGRKITPRSPLREGWVYYSVNTGLLVIAKDEQTHARLAKQFFDHTIQRRYVALVWGNFEQDEGTITGNIGRSPRERQKMYVFADGSDGKHAVTHYRVLKRYGYVTLIECRLETGRTHQIRVHMQWKGHPLFGDERYGGDRILKGTTFNKYKQFIENCFAAMPRQALHAKSLGFQHPTTGEQVYFESELPEDFRTVLAKWDAYAAAGLAEE